MSWAPNLVGGPAEHRLNRPPCSRRYRRGVDAATIAGLLADPARLKVVAALALGAGTIEEVAAASGLPLKDVALAARRLARAGLVHRDGHALALHAERFGAAARAAAEAAPPPEPLSDDPAEDAVLSAFVRDGRLRLDPGAAQQAAGRARPPGARLRARRPLSRARGQRAAGRLAPRRRRAAPLPGRRGPAHPRGRRLLAQRRLRSTSETPVARAVGRAGRARLPPCPPRPPTPSPPWRAPRRGAGRRCGSPCAGAWTAAGRTRCGPGCAVPTRCGSRRSTARCCRSSGSRRRRSAS